jgi:predicted amidohydrolase
VKVAAYQMPVDVCYSTAATNAISRIGEQVRRCEALGVAILCCPEGALGGLADYVDEPASIAINVRTGALDAMLAPLVSATVAAIVGFTEIDDAGLLYNTAAVFHRGAVVGLYRKRHPAIHSSRYTAGTDAPLFTIDGLTFGILICRDSVFDDLSIDMVRRGATALFVPTNNAMPRDRGGPGLVTETRTLDARRARELAVSVVRADVVGESRQLASDGSSAIVHGSGNVLSVAKVGCSELLAANIHPGLVHADHARR